VWRHPLHANIPHFFYSMIKMHQKIEKIFSFTPPSADHSCVPDAANRFLPATWITVRASVRRSARRLWPREFPSLDSFCKKTKTIAVPPQHLDQITTPPAENEDVTREWIFLKSRLHHPAESRKTTSQVGDSCGDPDARSRWQPDHPSKHSIAVRSSTMSTFPAMRSVPLASWISIDPTVDGEDA